MLARVLYTYIHECDKEIASIVGKTKVLGAWRGVAGTGRGPRQRLGAGGGGGLGFLVQGFSLRVQDSYFGFRTHRATFRVQGLGCMV